MRPGVPNNPFFGMEHPLFVSTKLYLPTFQVQMRKTLALDYATGEVGAITKFII
jgi:hypothetical protein